MGQTCDGSGRDLLAWKGDRDPQAVEGQSCPSPYVKYPEAQFGHKVGRISLTQQPSDQSLYTPLVYNSSTVATLLTFTVSIVTGVALKGHKT